jgi:hypothetical protein
MRQTISISKNFFCDGHCYVLTSASLGGSGLSVDEMSDILLEGNQDKTLELVKKGVCLPVCFEGDCALDSETLFVVGDLSEQEEKDWIARLRSKLNIPCGKLIICCGCLAEDLEPAVAGEKPDPHYEIYQVIDVPPAEYLVEIYAFLSSMTVQVSLDDYDDEGNYAEDDELARWYVENRPGVDGTSYVIRLTPLADQPASAEMEAGWLEKFEFRDAPNFE